MVAGIVLLALGLKKTLEHAEDPLETVPAIALVGGVATYLLALVAFRWRLMHTLSRPRTLAALAALALLPLALVVPAYVTVGLVFVVLCAEIVYEVVAYAEFRDRIRHQLARDHSAQTEAE
jgi:low temperature requirement protein LtrA